MWLFYVILLILLAFLGAVSGKEKPEPSWNCTGFYRIFLRPALWLLRRLAPYREKRRGTGEARRYEQMRLIYPANAEAKLRQQEAERISALLFCCFAGALAALLVILADRTDRLLEPDGWLSRRSYGKGSYEVALEATAGEDTGNLQISVKEREYTPEALEKMISGARERLEEQILGENESADCVQTDLYLPDRIDGYPFEIRWESGNYELVRTDGTVRNETVSEDGVLTEVKARLRYGDREWEESFWLRICPPVYSREEAFERQLLEQIEQSQDEARYDEKFRLPQQAGGTAVLWEEKSDPKDGWLFLLFLLAGAAQYVLPDREWKKRLMEREKQLVYSYPEFISKLVLFMGAGLPVRAALTRMVWDYRKKGEKKSSDYLYEEILFTCRELESGVTEIQAYERFGNRCGLPQYRKCVALLSQNVKKGASGLLAALQEEAERSFEERKRLAKEEGERAGTRLLLPMLMMLAVVMALIMVPACFSLT